MVKGAAAATFLSLLSAHVGAAEPAGPLAGAADALAALESEQAGLFARVAPSVVLLVGGGTSGSGFVVARGGLAITNAHVVGQDDVVAVQLFDGRHGRGRVLARATGSLDLALVQIPFDDLPPLPVAPSALRAGMFAATVGHGGGAAWTFSTGLVSNPRPLGDGAPMVLAQMALRPGSSGGPLVDRLGRVLAVVTAGTRDASGVTFAIRADAAAAAFPQLAAWDGAPGLAPDARPAPSATPETVALVAPPAPSNPVLGVSRLSSKAGDGILPAQPTMVTVWERPRAARRAAGRLPPRSRSAPIQAIRAAPIAAAAATLVAPAPVPSMTALAVAAGGRLAAHLDRPH